MTACTTPARCPKCRCRIEEDWERDYVAQVGQCRDCVQDAQPSCRICHDTYLMNVERGTCGLCEGAYENAILGIY
jgi:hypothetical protein